MNNIDGIYCLVEKNDILAISYLSKVFPELTGLEADARFSGSVFVNSDDKKMLYGTPMGCDSPLVLIAANSQEDVLGQLSSNACWFGVVTQFHDVLPPRLEQIALGSEGGSAGIIVRDALKLNNPGLYSRLIEGADGIRIRTSPLNEKFAVASSSVEPLRNNTSPFRMRGRFSSGNKPS